MCNYDASLSLWPSFLPYSDCILSRCSERTVWSHKSKQLRKWVCGPMTKLVSLWDLRFSCRGLWEFLSSGLWRLVVRQIFAYASEEPPTAAFGGRSTLSTEDGCVRFLQHVYQFIPDYKASHASYEYVFCVAMWTGTEQRSFYRLRKTISISNYCDSCIVILEVRRFQTRP